MDMMRERIFRKFIQPSDMKRSETRLLLEAFSIVTYKRVLVKK